MPPRVDPPIVDRDDVWMVERLGAAGLSQESLKQRGVLCERARENFESDLLIGVGMNCPEYRAHSADAQRLENSVAPNPRLGSRGSHRLGRRNRLVHQ